jgi:high-affinity iron transporter
MPDVFSVPIYFIVFRETLEAVIIISVLLGIADQIANTPLGSGSLPTTEVEKEKASTESRVHETLPSLPVNDEDTLDDDVRRKKLLRKMRLQVRQRVRPPQFSDQTLTRHRLDPRFSSGPEWVC